MAAAVHSSSLSAEKAKDLLDHRDQNSQRSSLSISHSNRASFTDRPIDKTSIEETERGERAQSQIQKDDDKQLNIFRRVTRFLRHYGIETHGITPTSPEQRTDNRIYQLFWLWFSANFNILAFSTGTAGPAFFGLGMWQSLVIIAVVDLVTAVVPAYFALFGPKLGTRGMVQCRFSWGLVYYGSKLPSLLNAFSNQGFLILNCIIGGQALAAVSGKIDDTVGIVIISLISLAVTFFGYQFLHWFESFAWVPSVISFPILIGLAGKHLKPSTFPAVPPPSAASVLSFASFVASSIISWCTLTPDYGVYHDSKAPTLKVFTYVYLGFLLPSIAWHMVGAAFAAAAPGIPSWDAGFEGGTNVGGLLAAVLSPAGGVGKFLLVLIALSTSCACAPTMYTFGLSFMAISSFFARIPRYVFVIVSEAILIPLAIIGAKQFYDTLVNVLSVIGYWSTAFAAIVLAEHFVFRRSFSSTAYPTQNWDKAGLLPPGMAAVFAFCCAFGIIIPCMKQTFYTGPIAGTGSGDVGVFVGWFLAFVVYVPTRMIERRIWPSA
ncbi:purine-cytosine permease [Crepidotus variabilis]|uniref:Purine-cytosine permease n=1 Tax=Crepidotus variabilis TaxID=179855 RepID=A0A9P6EE75_9AGAR|nr:purine-cytosine permease [Crepidotus variabilis]